MCGFAGLFLPTGSGLVEPQIDDMLEAISHRGPDGNGYYVSDDRRVFIGFVRLAIIDLDTGNQPFRDALTGSVMVGNGEIYNYHELRADPRVSDFVFQSKGDIETAFAHALRTGQKFVNDLRGMFALALVEKNQHRLTLVRDRLGIKPIYWTRISNGGILFASEIKALFASGLVTAEIDENSVNNYLSHGWVPGPATLYKGINALQPGHTLTANSTGDIELRCYWRPTACKDIPDDFDEIQASLLSHMREAVHLHMRSDVPIGILLSGGLDSGLLVALAAEQTGEKLNTFTVKFPEAAYDESPIALDVANRYGTRHEVFEVSFENVDDLLPRLAWYFDQPLFDAAAVPNMLIHKHLGNSMKVALNGSGGDEIFAGYGRYIPLAIEANYLRFPKAFREFLEMGIHRVSPITAFRLRRAEKFFTRPGEYLHEHTGHFNEPMRHIIGNKMPIFPAAQQYAYERSYGSHQTRLLTADLQTYLADDLMTLVDRTSMAMGVEGRVPFLDHPLVEFALAVPSKLRTAGGRQKALQRRIASQFLPEKIVEGRKQGFVSPVPNWWRSGLEVPAECLLSSRRTLERGWWTKNGVTKLFSNVDLYGYQIYTLVMLELCVRLHVEKQPISSLSEMSRV